MYIKHQNKALVKKNKSQRNSNIVEGVGNHPEGLGIENEEIMAQYQEDIALLESKLQRLDINYRGMLEREKKYLDNISELKDKLESGVLDAVSRQEYLKIQVNYEGLLAREERYLKEIQQLKDQVLNQKNGLYRTYSYRLGYLLIHSTKSFKNFISLPVELVKLYQDNKKRKKKKTSVLSSNITVASKNTDQNKIQINIHKPLEETYISEGREQVKIATIMDEFTSFCFAPEAETLQITPDSFKEELDLFKPDFVFIESAWQGKDGLWKLKVSQQAEELLDLIEYCRLNNIKTMFWNKEDPVHFGTFIEVAKLVDVVFTTDIDCIRKYKEITQHNAVYLLPFAAQPKIHNPIELFERIDKFNFAGSYYLKYPIRQRDFATLSEVAIESKGLDIYDRNYHNDHPHYQFPERYQSLILGSLAPDEIDKAYKGYTFGINMNTIKQSQTMFARRVFEMLASNTIVLSNYSRGVRLLFGDLVICSDDKNELQRQINAVLEDSLRSKQFKLQGLRSVLSQHTYEHRLNYILQKLKIKKNNAQVDDMVVVLAKCTSKESIEKIVAQFRNQTAHKKILLIESSYSIKEINSDITVKGFKDHESLKRGLLDLDFSHVTIFNENDYYGSNYLLDMIHSYHYLKYHQNLPVTKNGYYSYSQGQLVERVGSEYQFVNSYATARTLYTKHSFMELLNKYQIKELLEGLLIKAEAFSIDCLNYLQNGKNADLESREKICCNWIVDEGVSLPNHLLPIAENISFVTQADSEEKQVQLDITLIESSLQKTITFSHEGNSLYFNSSLTQQAHRLISLMQPIAIEKWNRLKINSNIQAKGDVLLVVEFLDEDNKQIAHQSLIPTPMATLEIPEKVGFVKLSLRMKGKSEASIERDIVFSLENIVKSYESKTYDSSDIVEFSKDDLNQQLVRPQSKQIAISNTVNGLEIKSSLAEDKHAYIYCRNIFTREEVNLSLNSLFEMTGEVVGCDIRTVFLFLDKNKEKLSHTIIKVDNCSHAMAIPEDCEFIRIGFKITGSGTASLHSLKIGEIRERVNYLVGKSDTLVLAKQYPAYDDLYKYGFLHSRLRAYKKVGEIVDMFKISSNGGKFGFSEFESIDIFTGDPDNLRETLSSGQFKRVFVHILDKNMWAILEEFVDQLEIIIWIHGAEIQSWRYREFEFELMTEAQVDRQKKLSDARVQFWQDLLDKYYTNVSFVFVSHYLKVESEEGLNRQFPDSHTHIIHNYIDENIFPFKEKKIEQRYKLLTIRPFAGKKYANDVTVNAILELSKSPLFPKFQIEICGDGPLFDETIAPIKHFENVIISKGFLSHAEMAQKYHEYGVFINPTRWDSQGVSRDEARIAGLISVSSNITAVPEFVSLEDGILVEMEDYKELAKQLLWLVENPEEFKKMSMKGRDRVLKQCSFDQTIGKELGLIRE